MRTIVLALATVGGVGYFPVASGTAGSLVALPLLPGLALVRERSTGLYAAVVIALVIVAVWAAGRAEEVLGGRDHSCIVVDEVAGMVVAGIFVPGTWAAAALAFVLFRVFDVAKPFPARRIDRKVHGGLGVVGDDLVAGLYAGVGSRLVLGLL